MFPIITCTLTEVNCKSTTKWCLSLVTTVFYQVTNLDSLRYWPKQNNKQLSETRLTRRVCSLTYAIMHLLYGATGKFEMHRG